MGPEPQVAVGGAPEGGDGVRRQTVAGVPDVDAVLSQGLRGIEGDGGGGGA